MAIPVELDEIEKALTKAQKDIASKQKSLDKYQDTLVSLSISSESVQEDFFSYSKNFKELMKKDVISLRVYKDLKEKLIRCEDLLTIVYPMEVNICQNTITKLTSDIANLQDRIWLLTAQRQEWGQIIPFPKK